MSEAGELRLFPVPPAREDPRLTQAVRVVEAAIFASADPVEERQLMQFLPDGITLEAVLGEIAETYRDRGVNLVRRGRAWAFRTAPDVASRLAVEVTVKRKLSRAAVETMAIIAYHQPVTRAEVEEIRGVALSKGTLDILLEAGWIQPRGRRQVPGRPLTWGTTNAFLDHFGLTALSDLPGIEELKAAGLLDRRPGVTALSMGDDASDDDDPDPEAEDDEPLSPFDEGEEPDGGA